MLVIWHSFHLFSECAIFCVADGVSTRGHFFTSVRYFLDGGSDGASARDAIGSLMRTSSIPKKNHFLKFKLCPKNKLSSTFLSALGSQIKKFISSMPFTHLLTDTNLLLGGIMGIWRKASQMQSQPGINRGRNL